MQEPFGCVSEYQENTSDQWDVTWYMTKKYRIAVLYPVIETTVAINAANNGLAVGVSYSCQYFSPIPPPPPPTHTQRRPAYIQYNNMFEKLPHLSTICVYQ